ncbi:MULTISPECIES: phosphate propanoyltransferase [unclassified Sporosarcina]|uniref:phosphate propanoyltransferase n=1 Tax=unclassified Sporosarcina TaxID=2647733 RepID=UPI000C16FB02|nr:MULTISPECIES: phosphate propanoyltransferase [unclassified Sporosarcina]PIC99919.1 propanediol utilization protein [Sporosarcina sp. P29]PID05866.1 propanediol utilization protein [Sporosarcina sp. P30]PID09060.1 propanediol utilization protein [Sporosarcina sp. P31]PID12357.1 propanediol utilization protein [Sporosarcina sp. P32b]
MDGEVIQAIVEDVIKEMTTGTSNSRAIPISISARHCHLCQKDIETLFGPGYELTKRSELSQPGQFAANETVTLIGPRDSIHSVRILGPARSVSQVEVSKTDGVKLGINPPLRESGDIKNSASITLVGTKGSVYLKEGLIVAKAHIHMRPKDAQTLKVDNGDYVKVTVQNERPVTFEKVLIRVSPNYITDMHIDTDEANAGAIENGSFGKIRHIEKNNE